MKIEKDSLQNLPLGTTQKNKAPAGGKSNKPDTESDGSDSSGEAAKVDISGPTQSAAAEMSEQKADAIAKKTATAIAEKKETVSALHHPISSRRAEELFR